MSWTVFVPAARLRVRVSAWVVVLHVARIPIHMVRYTVGGSCVRTECALDLDFSVQKFCFGITGTTGLTHVHLGVLRVEACLALESALVQGNGPGYKVPSDLWLRTSSIVQQHRPLTSVIDLVPTQRHRGSVHRRILPPSLT
jgi:hypothetical protein